MVNSLDRLQNDILMDITVDVLWVLSCRTYGWNGQDDSESATKLLGTLIALRYAGIDRNLLLEMNDSGFTFDEIADYIDRIGNNRY